MVLQCSFVADEGFPLQENVKEVSSGMHPKGSIGRIFNYHLCQAHRVVENILQITSSVFHILWKLLLLQPERAEPTVMAMPHFHMFLGKSAHSAGICTPPDTLDHEVEGNLDKENMTSLLPIKTITCRSASDAKEVREAVAQYRNTRGHMSWQDIHKLILNHAQLLTWLVSN